MSKSLRYAGIACLLFVMALAGAVAAPPQAAPLQHDAETDQEICRVTMGISPHEAAFFRDGKTLYVPVYSSANVGAPGTDEHVPSDTLGTGTGGLQVSPFKWKGVYFRLLGTGQCSGPGFPEVDQTIPGSEYSGRSVLWYRSVGIP